MCEKNKTLASSLCRQGVHINIEWVPGYAGIPGSKEAHSIACAALFLSGKKTSPSLQSEHEHAKRRDRAHCLRTGIASPPPSTIARNLTRTSAVLSSDTNVTIGLRNFCPKTRTLFFRGWVVECESSSCASERIQWSIQHELQRGAETSSRARASAAYSEPGPPSPTFPGPVLTWQQYDSATGHLI